ncbi:MAG: nicotinate phosphoribosyltransferase [Candidatus Thermoplasmatota archaeon]|nr:nicotinate phosphoribosyltransferase [Candidatus Thermoplasmatota archaeon]
MMDITATYTDLYELTMAQVYHRNGLSDKKAVFDVFFRRSPFNGGYAVFAGLSTLLDILHDLRFDPSDLEYLLGLGFEDDFLDHLKKFRFKGDVRSVREGEIVFPTEVILQVEADMLEAQIVETLVLNILNFQTLIATKASRIRSVAPDKVLIDFGLRRAQGMGGYHASRAAYIGGFDSTSNVRAGRDFGMPVSGTMAHSFVQSRPDELTAFREYSSARPDDCVLLVDTYNTLRSGIPNAITVAKEMEGQGRRLKGIRLDSGDLAYLSREARRMLDDNGLGYVRIAASNQLDEYVIRSLKEQEAPIDVYGVGTNLVVGYPDGALDGVYKLSMFNDVPCMKLSENVKKVTLPFKKQIFRYSNDGWTGADAIVTDDESKIDVMYDPFDPYRSLDLSSYEYEPLMNKVLEGGEIIQTSGDLERIREYASSRLAQLPPEYKRFENPHIYKVGISPRIRSERDRFIKELRMVK